MPRSKPTKEPPVSVKGMRDILGEEYFEYEGFMEKASEIALYYGFKPIETPILEKKEVFTTGVGEGTDIVEKEMYELKTKGGDHLVMRPEGTAAVMRAYIEHGMQAWPHPVMLYYKGPLFRHEKHQHGRYRQFWQFGIECIGSGKSVMDATVIHVIMTILNDAKISGLSVEINSIGSKESRTKYVRDLTSYYRKHFGEICADCKRRLTTNPLRLLDCKNEKCQPIKDEAPDSVSSLISEDRKNFTEVLEYLEALDIPYEINNHLVRGIDYYSKTVFEITHTTTETDENGEEVTKKTVIAAGGRYDYLAKNLGSKKDTPSIGASIGVDRVLLIQDRKNFTPRIIKKPKVFFIQLGHEAKMKSLKIIEILRKARVPITQTINKDGLSSQLALAEKLGVPYTIIFGQKECIEDSVIIRNMETHSQDTIKIKDLAQYVKTLK